MAKLLVKNGLLKLVHLRYADHPREWSGAEQFTIGELEGVWKLKGSSFRQRSRSPPRPKQIHWARGIALLDKPRPPNASAAGLGPMATLKSVEEQAISPAQRAAWLGETRIDAILGATCRSQKSVRSGVRCWMAFVDKFDPVKRRYFPPSLELLLSWSTLFRSGQTLRNYLGYLQTGCILFNVPVTVFHEPALRKAKMSIDKALNFKRRERMFISWEKVEAMVVWSAEHTESQRYALLFLFAYTFLLRTPSEAVPAVAGAIGVETGSNAEVFLENDSLVLVLKRRKNRPEGSRLVRACSCHKTRHACTFHLIGQLVKDTPAGVPIFGNITASGAVTALRHLLEAVGTERAQFYRPHDLRRGHAEDLRLAGAPLCKILAAGEWRSPAFLQYLDVHRMEVELVMQGCLDEESDCDVEP